MRFMNKLGCEKNYKCLLLLIQRQLSSHLYSRTIKMKSCWLFCMYIVLLEEKTINFKNLKAKCPGKCLCPEKVVVSGLFRILHNDTFCDLYLSSNIIMKMKSRTLIHCMAPTY
jgi:hypothetical protein